MRVRFRRLNFERECMWDIISGNGFLISDTAYSDVDKSIRNIDGPRSPRFGTTYGDVNEFMDRYRCGCTDGHGLVGSAFEGKVCPRCGKKVEYTDVNIMYTGWINFSPYKIISPLSYLRLQSALGKKVLEDLINSDNMITSSGVIRKHNEEVEVKKQKLLYHNIGIDAFYRNYEEIMYYYKGKRKQKADQIQRLIDEKDLVWTSKLPVMSTALRQQGITTESFYFQATDREINPLVAISINLKTANYIEVPLYLFQAQERANKLWGIVFQLIDTKHGWIRKNVLGGEFNYSMRAEIVLDPTLRIDEVDVPYKMFVEDYKNLIIRRIRKERGWTITKAANFLAARFEYDPYIYRIMCQIIEEERPRCIISRNP